MVKPKNLTELLDIVHAAIDKNGPEVDLNYIDTSLITNMSFIFRNSEFNGDISKWDTSKVKHMKGMFLGSKFNGDISRWDVRNVEAMNYMFAFSKFNQDIGRWNIDKLHFVSNMFNDSEFDHSIYRLIRKRPDIDWDISCIKPELLENTFYKNWMEYTI
jgi:surface protein